MTTQIDWEALSHGAFTEALAAGLAERDRRIQQLAELTGGVVAQQPERRGPGRPPGSTTRPSTRAEQLAAAAAESAESVQ